MSFQNRFTFSSATEKDIDGVRKLFSSQSFDGNISVQYLRGENPLASFLKEGDDFVCLILRDSEADDLIIGMGSCVIRKGYVDDKVCNLGYLTGLKLLPQYHKKFFGIAKAYRWIFEHTEGKVDYYYTTILSENIYVRNMLEKKRKNMPTYQNIGGYRTLIFKTGGEKRVLNGYEVRGCSGETASKFYIDNAKKYLFSVATPTQNGLANSRHYALYKGDEIIAIASVLDQRHDKQYVVKRYGGIYRLARFLPSDLFGYPKFPKPDETVSLASVSVYSSPDVSPQELRFLFEQLQHSYTDTELLMIGFHDRHPMSKALAGTKHVGYNSVLYRVSFNQEETFAGDDIAGVDVAFC